MSDATIYLLGTLRGQTIQLVTPSDLPDGQPVVVSLRAIEKIPHGMLRAFGAWSDDPEGLDEFVRQVYRDRENDPRNQPTE